MLDNKTFLIKERVAFMKLTDTYDILDPATALKVGEARETPEEWQKWLRLVIDKRMLPTQVTILGPDGATSLPSLVLDKPFGILRSYVHVRDGVGRRLGTLVSKVFTLGGGLRILDAQDNEVADMSGDWKGWNFTIKDTGGRQWGTVTKQWAGVGKELFTSADNYVVDTEGAPDQDRRALVLAAGLAIDMVFKESK